MTRSFKFKVSKNVKKKLKIKPVKVINSRSKLTCDDLLFNEKWPA